MPYSKLKGLMADGKSFRYVQVDAGGRLVIAPSVEGPWITGYIPKTGTSTATIDLGDAYMYMRIIIPTLDTATLKVTVAETPSGTYYDLSSVTTASGTHNYATTFLVGGYRYIKLVASAAQNTAAITLRVSGLGLI